MEADLSSTSDAPNQAAQQQLNFESASNFLEICDRLSTGYEYGLYWEDVQRALRIAAGLEKWP